jgi:hypothetical protein
VATRTKQSKFKEFLGAFYFAYRCPTEWRLSKSVCRLSRCAYWSKQKGKIDNVFVDIDVTFIRAMIIGFKITPTDARQKNKIELSFGQDSRKRR